MAASMSSISQKLVQMIGMMSNCNVSIQQWTSYTYSFTNQKQYRLCCDVCGSTQPLEGEFVMETIIANSKTFCSRHRHEGVGNSILQDALVQSTPRERVVIMTGRKYREE